MKTDALISTSQERLYPRIKFTVCALPGSCSPIAYAVHTVLTRQITPPFTYVNLFSSYSIGSHCHSVFFRLVSPLLHTVDLDASFFVASLLTEGVLHTKEYDTEVKTRCQ